MGWTAFRASRGSRRAPRARRAVGWWAATMGVAALATSAACAGPTPGADTLTVGAGPDRYLNELPQRPDLTKYPLNAGVLETLVRMNEALDVEPLLAERWEYDDARNTYLFHLRPGVRFHDGAELTADDVKFTFDLIAKADPSNYQQIGPGSVRVIDPHTVAITPMQPNRRLAEQIAHPIWGINRHGTDVLRPVGTGPFTFVEYVKHDRLVVARHDTYWREDRRAKAAQVVFRFVADAHARFLALRAGQINIAADVPPEVLPMIAGDPALRLVKSPPGASHALTFNIKGDEPYVLGREPAVRAAVARAVDRASLVGRVWQGAAEPSLTWLSPAVFGPHRAIVAGVPFDLERATSGLERDGWRPGPDGIRVKNGRRLSLVLVVSFPTDEHLSAPELLQQQMRAAGIEIRIELASDPGVFASRRRAGQFDLIATIVNQNDPYPCFLPDLLHYSQSRSPATKFASPGGAVDLAIQACRAATSTAEARQHAAEAIAALVDDAHVVVPVAGIYRMFATTARVSGLVPHPSNTNQRWDTVTLSPR